MFKVTARDQGHYEGPSGAFVTYCNISCFQYVFMKLEGLKGRQLDRSYDSEMSHSLKIIITEMQCRIDQTQFSFTICESFLF